MADAKALAFDERTIPTRFGGLFLFVSDLVRLGLDSGAQAARLPGSKMIPRGTSYARY